MRGRLVTSGQAYFKLVLKRGDFSKVLITERLFQAEGTA